MDLPDSHQITHAARVLRSGGLVAFPTETVYGLGADARNPDAVRRIFAAKGRPADHPLIVHLARAEWLDAWARDIPDAAHRLAQACWPGPLTLILRRAADVSPLVTGGQDTIGLRVPAHPVAQALLEAFGSGIAAPSANRYGHVSPTRAEHVAADLGDAVDCILDGGACAIGVESTIVDLTGARPHLLRPGALTRAQLQQVVAFAADGAADGVPRVSGSHAAHYAPRTPLRLVPADQLDAALRQAAGRRIAVVARTRPAGATQWVAAEADAAAYAHALYARLRELDAAGHDLLLFELPPAGDAWLAVHDRLRRAATGSGTDEPSERGGT